VCLRDTVHMSVGLMGEEPDVKEECERVKLAVVNAKRSTTTGGRFCSSHSAAPRLTSISANELGRRREE
jgi:hypothetical protein